MERRDIAKPRWCVCGCCYKVPKEDECVCCQEPELCRSKCEEFQTYLRNKLKREKLEKCIDQLGPEEPDEQAIYGSLTLLGKLRRICYRKTDIYFFHKTWYPQDKCDEVIYTPLPSCIKWAIKRQYEEQGEKGGQYTGFPPKSDLLQPVVKAHETFEDKMKTYESVLGMVSPDEGLLTSLNDQIEEKRQNVYSMLRSDVGADRAESWTASVGNTVNVLPNFTFVACATAFETFVHDTVKLCYATLNPARKVHENEKKNWIADFKNWLKERGVQAKAWQTGERSLEVYFWQELLKAGSTSKHAHRTRSGLRSDSATPSGPTSRKPQHELDICCATQAVQTDKASESIFDKLELTDECNLGKVFRYLVKNPSSQRAVGLVQDIVDNNKEKIFEKLSMPTWRCVRVTFAEIAVSIHNRAKTRKRPQSDKAASPKKKKPRSSRKDDNQVSAGATDPSQEPTQESSAGVSDVAPKKGLSPGELVRQETEQALRRKKKKKKKPRSSRKDGNQVSAGATDPSQEPTQESSAGVSDVASKEGLSPGEVVRQETEQALTKLADDYVCRSECSWQMWIGDRQYQVKCNDVKTVAYLSNILYGIRCIFSHGSSSKTLRSGVLSADRIPKLPSDLNVTATIKNTNKKDGGRRKEGGEEMKENSKGDGEKEREIGQEEEELVETVRKYLFKVRTDAIRNKTKMNLDHNLVLVTQSFYKYFAEIIGRVAACFVYKYTEETFREKIVCINSQEVADIRNAVDVAWTPEVKDKTVAAAMARTGASQEFEDMSMFDMMPSP